jgi:hypothetical protein
VYVLEGGRVVQNHGNHAQGGEQDVKYLQRKKMGNGLHELSSRILKGKYSKEHHSGHYTVSKINETSTKNIQLKNACVKGESNPQLNLGRVPCYHYTINALGVVDNEKMTDMINRI